MEAHLSSSPFEIPYQPETETARQIADVQDSGGISFEERLSCVLNKSQPSTIEMKATQGIKQPLPFRKY